ncbi:MAG: hypothetical protein PHH54_06360 [Candidatus Nanoarchaeia archaeon]|nr:hypothetical protein [Candidatus Nanoarchaeia archaeon]MDD5741578.1 hypothetical protein [Candidatus Nanoarchaeia archaeon]
MVTKNKLAIILTLIAATIFGLNSWTRLNEARSNKIIDVPIARARYSNGEVLESMDFISCSALILDYKDKAIMAHAPDEEYANYMFEWGVPPEGNDVYIGNVVKYLSNEMREKGINPKECKAFINAGSERGLEKITNDLKEAGIGVESSKLDQNPRNMRYDPKTNNLTVNYRSD